MNSSSVVLAVFSEPQILIQARNSVYLIDCSCLPLAKERL